MAGSVDVERVLTPGGPLDVDGERRLEIESSATFNGIDYVEVDPADQRVLEVGFLHPLPGEADGVPAGLPLDPGNVLVEGGERVSGIETVAVAAAGRVLRVTVDMAGDFSTYRLRLARSAVDPRAPVGFDPALAGAALLVQGQLRQRPGLRDTSRAFRRAAVPGAAGLSGQGLRRVPPADARPDREPRARRDRREPGGSARRPRGVARVPRGPVVLQAGRRGDRGVPRHGSQQGLRTPARPAARLRGARRVHGAGVAPGRGRAGDRGDGRAPGPHPRCCRAARARPSSPPPRSPGRWPPARWRSRRCRPCGPSRRRTWSRSIRGARCPACCPPGARPRASSEAPHSSSRPATCCSSRRSPARRPGARPTPTSRTGRWSG